jgi:hypothetical protein
MRLRNPLRSRARQVFLLVASYALMTVGAPLAGAGMPACPIHDRAAGMQVASAPVAPCHEAGMATRADAAAAQASDSATQAHVPAAQHAPAKSAGNCCPASLDHQCGCTFGAAAALPTLALAFSHDATPVFSARWTTTARDAEPPSRLLRPPIR